MNMLVLLADLVSHISSWAEGCPRCQGLAAPKSKAYHERKKVKIVRKTANIALSAKGNSVHMQGGDPQNFHQAFLLIFFGGLDTYRYLLIQMSIFFALAF